MFQPWESYIPLKYNVDYGNEISNDIIDDIELKCLQIYQIFKKYDEVYKKIVNDNYAKIKSLKLGHVEYYMYHCAIAYMDTTTNIDKK
jgi:hypothetical protein